MLALAVDPVIPPSAQPGILEKSLEKYRPETEPPPQTVPDITIQDSRTQPDAGAGPTFFVRRIKIEGNTLISDETLAPFGDVGEGIEATLGILTLYANEVTSHYASQGYFLTRAYIPEQEIKNGVVLLQVVEGRVGKVKVTGNKRIDSEDILERSWRVQRNQILQEADLERTLLELNDIMGLEVRSVLKPGERPGTSDVILDVKETRPYRIFFDADNFGSRFTGENRFGVTGAIGNLVLLGDELSIRIVKSDKDQLFVNPTLLFPVGPLGTYFKFSYSYSEHELGQNLSALNAGGHSHIFHTELTYPLFRTRNGRLNVRGGVEVRSFENKILGKNSSKDNLTDIFLGLGGDYTDSFKGRTFFDAQVKFGTREGDGTRALSSRFMGQGNETVANFNVTRYQGTGLYNAYFILKANGQETSGRVLSPDQMSVGGMGSVRGYPLSEYAGDAGYALSGELVIPLPWKFPVAPRKAFVDGVVSLIGFIDHGKVFVKDTQPGEEDQGITGIGGGIRISASQAGKRTPHSSFSFVYGTPAFDSPDPSDDSCGIFYFSGLIGFW